MSQVFVGSRPVSFDTFTTRPLQLKEYLRPDDFMLMPHPYKEHQHILPPTDQEGHLKDQECKCKPVVIGEHEYLVVWFHTPFGKCK